jgi:SAM-dependent methyltransferase
MISPSLLSVVWCPDCRHALSATAGGLQCPECGRTVDASGSYLDLRPRTETGEATKYLDDALHADGRQASISPPLLSAAIRNDMLRRLLRPGPGDRWVDLGCGSGRMLLWNRAAGASMTGVDVSPHFADEAHANLDLVLGDLRRLPLASNSFTKACSLDVAEHLTHDGLEIMLSEAARVLAPDGQLFLYSHVRRSSPLAVVPRAVNRCAALLDRVGLIDLQQERLRKSDHLNPLADLDDLHRTAAKAGFRIADIRYYNPVLGAVIENIVLRLAERALAWRVRRRVSWRASATGDDALPGAGTEHDTVLRDARTRGKQMAAGGATGAVLRFLTWVMKIDILLFSRVKAGPFFALLVKDVR